jgi:pyrroloquinoline quinone (PQQ) biosynthesis protein C
MATSEGVKKRKRSEMVTGQISVRKCQCITYYYGIHLARLCTIISHNFSNNEDDFLLGCCAM